MDLVMRHKLRGRLMEFANERDERTGNLKHSFRECFEYLNHLYCVELHNECNSDNPVTRSDLWDLLDNVYQFVDAK